VTVPAVKSLLVRARMGLVEAIEAREADCGEIRDDLLRAYDRGVKASGRARKHMRSCSACRDYREALRGVRRSFAALTPVGFGPLALAAKLGWLGGGGAAASGGAAAAGGGAAASGGAAAITTGGIATATACKVAAVVCTAALAGGAMEVNREISHRAPSHTHSSSSSAASVAKASKKPAAQTHAAPVATHRAFAPVVPDHASMATVPVHKHRAAKAKTKKDAAAKLAPPTTGEDVKATEPAADDPSLATGGARAPDAPGAQATPTPVATEAPAQPIANAPQPTPEPAQSQSGAPPADGTANGAAPAPTATPTPAG